MPSGRIPPTERGQTTKEPARMRRQRQVDQRRGVKEATAKDFRCRHDQFVFGIGG